VLTDGRRNARRGQAKQDQAMEPQGFAKGQVARNFFHGHVFHINRVANFNSPGRTKRKNESCEMSWIFFMIFLVFPFITPQ
jgi:hypothetical protein